MRAKICPDDETLMDFIEGRLSTRQRADIETHLAVCHRCREQVTVCSELIYGETADDVPAVPLAVTLRVVEQVTRLSTQGPQDTYLERTRKWVVDRGSAMFEQLSPLQEAALLRGGEKSSPTGTRLQTDFENINFLIEAEKTGHRRYLIRIIPDRNNAHKPPVRITLLENRREAASMLLTAGQVIFEEISPGPYTLLFSRGGQKKQYDLEVGNSLN